MQAITDTLWRVKRLSSEMGAFEGFLPSTDTAPSLQALLAIKHCLFQRLRERQKKEEKERRTFRGVLREKWKSYWKWMRDQDDVTPSSLGTVITLGMVLGGFASLLLTGVVHLVSLLPFIPVSPTLTTYAVALGVGEALVCGGFPFVWAFLVYPLRQFQRLGRQEDELETLRTRLNDDPVFFLSEVEGYVREEVDGFHNRFTGIRGEFEKAVIRPREEVKELLSQLQGKRREAEGKTTEDDLPGKSSILREIDRLIEVCEGTLSATDPRAEPVQNLLSEVGQMLEKLYAYPNHLATLRNAYSSQEGFLAELQALGARVEELRKSRAGALDAVTRELSSLRSEMGLALRTIDDFCRVLPESPKQMLSQ
ncbi:MAG: hypothetical protein Q8P01_00610 [bacterium]|nr:hypothetical protein [bacterium]